MMMTTADVDALAVRRYWTPGTRLGQRAGMSPEDGARRKDLASDRSLEKPLGAFDRCAH